MFIAKLVIIQGFKSYREQTVVEPFHPKHNVVVGRNGSGKSNFFYAIQFVLSDEFNHLRPEQRQALLHEGTGPKVISAYVEIIFDNSDQRLPIDKDEVALRRVIGSKKDQYFLNKKLVTRTDVLNLLESAGFSRSNPYYIVKQGKINQMATAPDSYRLKLLREVAGTRVYDERREESVGILRETDGKIDKIEDFLRTIEDRLQTLEEEKEELKEYQKWDKMRRALEYTVHDRELKETKKKLEDMEKDRSSSGKNQEKRASDLKEAQDKVKAAAKTVKEIKTQGSSAKEEIDSLKKEMADYVKEKTRLDNSIKDLNEDIKGDADSRNRAMRELEDLENRVKEKTDELNSLKPKYEDAKAKEEAIAKQLATKEQKRKELYARQGRGSQFASKKDRDVWIKNELKALNRAIKEKEDQIEKLEDQIKRDSDRKVELERRVEELTAEMETHRQSIEDHNRGFYEMKKRKDQLASEKNELWRQENELQTTIQSLREENGKHDQNLKSMVGKAILNGRDSVRRVLETFTARGGYEAETVKAYHGLVIENFECEKSIYTAVEVTSGNKLFHHIVDSDRVGTAILKEMNRQKLPGDVTFMPINRLAVRPPNYPENNKDAIPMVSKLNYEEHYAKVMKFMFGRTLICRNLEVATNLARTTELDCVTIDGDQVSSKGSLTGGYFNTSRSRLELQKNFTQTKAALEIEEVKFTELKDKIRKVETEINSIVSEMQRTETKNSKAKDVFDKVKADVRLMREELNNIVHSQPSKERSLAQLKSSLETMLTSKEGFEAEINQDLMETLSVNDQLQADQLDDEIRALTQGNKVSFSQRMQLEATKSKLENLLQNNLLRRRDELNQALQEISVEDRQRILEQNKSELDAYKKRIQEAEKKLKAAEKSQSSHQATLKDAQNELEKWKVKEKDTQELITKEKDDLDRMANKQTTLMQKIEDCQQKIRDLGSLPSEAFDKYQSWTTKQLFKQLEKANSELKKYSHVNKKALDQFMSFSEQKEKLMKRKEELDTGKDKIKELMSVLEQRKYEAIQNTFTQVSKNFTEVFKKLVPYGSGELLMESKTTGEEAAQDSEEGPVLDNFTGVGIRVAFNGEHEMKEMNQLSGGQKSLVALALIFAIQKCDPAPFYLFDEIDAALDANHRAAVANMIHELSGEAQFITTTFRPELLLHANKFYGVRFRNKVSHIDCVTREEAYDFVEDDQTHG